MWIYSGYTEVSTQTSMSEEEIDQAYGILEAKLKAYGINPSNDIEPLLTIDGYEIILSFVMNQDDTFTTNMMETYTEVTLNYFDNLKVRYNAVNLKNDQAILNAIYRGFMPNFFY